MSSRIEPRSITSQLVLRFTVATTLLLSCSLGAFYWMVVRHAIDEDNAVLGDKTAAIRADLESSRGFDSFAQEVNRSHRGEPLVHWVRLLDQRGQVLAETPAMENLLPPQVFPTPARSTSSFPPPQSFRTNDRLFALIAFAHNDFIVQIAQDRSEDDEFRAQFGVLFLIVLGLAIAAAVFIATRVARRGLRPLTEMTESVARIGPAHFRERILPAQSPPELRPLAAAFDDMLRRLEDSFIRLSQFSADLAHELRTPIANILGEMQVTLTRERAAPEYRAAIESAVAECERLSAIVDNLLFLARAEATDRQIERVRFDARAAVEEIADYYRAAAEDRHVAIACTGQGHVCAEPMLFRRALGNIIDNALRFAPNEGRIDIAVHENNYGTEIIVRDNGPGIAAEHLSRVFDRFYRVDPSRTESGAGLGLSLVKSILDLHGGAAWIEGEGGTAVRLNFPATEKEACKKMTNS